MTKPEKAELLKAILYLAAAFDQPLSEARQKIYLESLSDLPLQPVLSAVKQAIQTCKFFPSIAEIRELAGHGNQKQALEDQAVMAWDRLRSLRGRAYNPEALECPITKKCFRAMGGTMGFGMWDYEAQEQWKRKQFIEMFKTLSRTGSVLKEISHDDSVGALKRLELGGLA